MRWRAIYPFIDKLWYDDAYPWLTGLLTPFSWVYLLIHTLKKKMTKRRKRQACCVVVVGNLTVGGNGKTPCVAGLATFLDSKGYRIAVIMRGYGGRGANAPVLVTSSSDPAIVGDEALLLAQHLTCPIIIDKKRVRAVDWIMKNHPVDIIISDDGLQHDALQRNIEIVVVDAVRQFGNQRCLPAGPLREPLSRLKTVDFILQNGDEQGIVLQPQDFIHLTTRQTKQASDFKNSRCIAIAGIGHPKRFFDTLTSLGIHATTYAFPDHHPFKKEDFLFDPDACILMTEKDAMKCRTLGLKNAWYLPVKAKYSEQFLMALEYRIKAILSK